MAESFLIPLDGSASRREFRWNAGKEFFAGFGNSEVLDADIDVDAVATGRKIDCSLHGTITVPCDRCLEPVTLEVSHSSELLASEDEEADGNGREVVPVQAEAKELDLSQTVYDYALLSLPLRRVHPDGECDEKVLEYLSSESADEAPSEGASPFVSLKGLMDGEK